VGRSNMVVERRTVIKGWAATLVVGSNGAHGQEASRTIGRDEWMQAWMALRAPEGLLHLARFQDENYVLTREIRWRPEGRYALTIQPVTVPSGFVTDLASIPRMFYSLLRPDGRYSFPAIVHDYLYWTQEVSRPQADEIFRQSMMEFDISRTTIATIHGAVRMFGGSAWRANAKAKANGERRVLSRLPDDPRILWKDFKMRKDVWR
jgi:hypothetical protein